VTPPLLRFSVVSPVLPSSPSFSHQFDLSLSLSVRASACVYVPISEVEEAFFFDRNVAGCLDPASLLLFLILLTERLVLSL
jgi:hypothetical protein